LSFSMQPRLHAADQDAIDPSLNEHVIYVASDPAHRAMLQVTTFYPDGDGPFPLAIMNHSKAVGDPKNEPRYRSIFLSRYFLSRGYAVALPMMRGFAGSGGVFHINKCDLEGFGLADAADIAASFPPATNYAALDDVDAVPNATDKTKQAYREFLTKPFPRVFVITPNGGCGSFEGGFDPLTRALEAFRSRGAEGRVYAVDDRVVWTAPARTPAATQFAPIDNVEAVPYLNATGRKGYEFFLALPKPRAFVIAPDGGWAVSSKGFDPLTKALRICSRNHQNCRPYAVDDHVVWTEDQPARKQ
jgi:hypothetical protein